METTAALGFHSVGYIPRMVAGIRVVGFIGADLFIPPGGPEIRLVHSSGCHTTSSVARHNLQRRFAEMILVFPPALRAGRQPPEPPTARL